MADKKAEDWAKKNPWFGKDHDMTNVAFKIHDDLVNKEKIEASSDKYYSELDKRIKKEALEFIINGSLYIVPKEFYKDKSIVLEAVKQYGFALEYADESLKKDKSIVLEAVKQNGDALQFADESLKKDRSIVLEAVKQNGYALQFADESLKKDRSIIVAAFKTNGSGIFRFVDKTLKKNLIDKELKEYFPQK